MVVRNDYRDKEERYQLILDLKKSRLKSSGKQPLRSFTQFWREKVYNFSLYIWNMRGAMRVIQLCSMECLSCKGLNCGTKVWN